MNQRQTKIFHLLCLFAEDCCELAALEFDELRFALFVVDNDIISARCHWDVEAFVVISDNGCCDAVRRLSFIFLFLSLLLISIGNWFCSSYCLFFSLIIEHDRVRKCL